MPYQQDGNAKLKKIKRNAAMVPIVISMDRKSELVSGRIANIFQIAASLSTHKKFV